MHPATPEADRAIVSAVDELNRCAAALRQVRADLGKVRLPLAIAEDRLDHLDDTLATADAQLQRITETMDGDFARILQTDAARYDAANDDSQEVEAA